MAKSRKQKNVPPYLNPDNSVAVRIQDLLDRMTLEEKIAETGYVYCSELIKNDRLSPDLAKKFLAMYSDVEFIFCFKPETYKIKYHKEAEVRLTIMKGTPYCADPLSPADFLLLPIHKLKSTTIKVFTG